jgi:hypothetical protein
LPQIVRRVAGSEPPFSMLPPPAHLAESVLELLFRGIGRPMSPAAGEAREPVTEPSTKKSRARARAIDQSKR